MWYDLSTNSDWSNEQTVMAVVTVSAQDINDIWLI